MANNGDDISEPIIVVVVEEVRYCDPIGRIKWV